MEPKLQTLPHYFKTETSPMIQHSAFPPFKIEHRYRGVYERAGFDVNLNGSTLSSDGRSMKSPISQKFPANSGGNTSVNTSANSIHSVKKNDSDSVMPSSAKTSKSFGELEKHTPYPVHENRVHSESQPNTSLASPVTPGVKSTHTQVSEGHHPNSERSNIPTFQIQQVDSSKNAQLPPPNTNGFNFTPSMQNKNLKNLSLNLNDQDDLSKRETNERDNDSTETESFETTTEVPAERFQNTKDDRHSRHSSQSSIKTDELLSSSPTQVNHGLPSPPPTSRSYELQPDDSLIKKQRLSSALNEFRKDIEDHKNYIPKSPSVPNSPALKNTPQLPTASPSQIGLSKFEPQRNIDNRFSYNQSYVNNSSNDTFDKVSQDEKNMNPSDQFQNFRDEQFATDHNLNSEYQNFLKLGKKSEPRDSQVSMVSSILSKDSNYSQDEEADETMERQLQALKVGNANDASSVEQVRGEELGTETKDLPLESMSKEQSIPTFNIENIDDDNEKEPISNPRESYDDQDFEDHNNTTWESIKPLCVNHSENKKPDNDGEGDSRGPTEEGNHDMEVKPLSPKNHLVEEELKNINFPAQDLNATNEKQQLENKPEQTTKYPSGQGPCRACKNDGFSTTKGPQKSVFSKTGELSGQWHRACFTCAYSGCDIHFSKSVQCYVFDDNAFCHNHYHELNDTLCQMCSRGIEGECVENELYQKWHLYCLTCHKCQDPINKDYYLINGASYCETDAVDIIKDGGSYKDADGNMKTGGLTISDKVEKRRTRIMYVE